MNYTDDQYYQNKMLHNTTKIENQIEILDDVITKLDDTNNIAEDSYENLLVQKDHIIKITHKTEDLNNNVRKSNGIIKKMKCNHVKDNICVILIICILLLMIIIILIIMFVNIYNNYFKT